MRRIFKKSRTKGTNRLALLCIGDNAHDDGLAFPGVDELARKMGGVSRRSAGKRVEALSKTTELGVYPRRGRSHDYIVFTDMTLSEARVAIRKMLNKRRMTISELHYLRRLFASGKWAKMQKESRVGAKPDSREVRSGIRTNHQEPSDQPAAAAARKSIFTIWEEEARMTLSPILGDNIGDLLDEYGHDMLADAIREAVRSTGPGQFGIKYVEKICVRWKREGKIPRRHEAAQTSGKPSAAARTPSPHPPRVKPVDPEHEAKILSPKELAEQAKVLLEAERKKQAQRTASAGGAS